MVRPVSCVNLAGASPVRVITGEPGSRPRPRPERTAAERGVTSLCGGSKAAGRNRVNATASTDYQPKGVREGRAAHVTAKAIDSARQVPGRVLDLSGVWATARGDRETWNRRDPPWRPASGKDRAYKTESKARGARRESEGFIVPVKAGKRNRQREGTLLWSRRAWR
jgi:hypothetical protein